MKWQALTASIALSALALGAPAPLAAQAGRSEAYFKFLLGRYYEGEGETDRAAAAYREAARLDPGSAEVRAELAGLYARQDMPREATEWGEAALRVDPENRDAHRVLGFVAASGIDVQGEGRLDDPSSLAAAIEAIRHLEAARYPNRLPDLAVELTLARLYLRSGVPEKAIPVLLRLRELDPERGPVVLMLAGAYEAAGQLDLAIDSLEIAVERRPLDSGLLNRLGDLLFKLGRYREAVSVWERALSGDRERIDPDAIRRKVRSARQKESGR